MVFTRFDVFKLQALSAVLRYMGNDPRVFCLYFTCKCLYQLFRKRSTFTFGGFDKFYEHGCDWIISMKDVKTTHLQPFFRKLFDGYIVCDFHPLYALFCLKGFPCFKIPVNIVKYFYVVKYEGYRDMNNISLYVMKKHRFHVKMNIVSVNEAHIIQDPMDLECKMYNVVMSGYKAHEDSFVIGIKANLNGVLLTSCFVLGNFNYFGVTCYTSLKLMVKHEGLNFKMLKKFFNYTPFMNRVFAMFQCENCCPFVMRLLRKVLFHDGNFYYSNFERFKSVVKFNSKKRNRYVDMSNYFTLKFPYVKTVSLPRIFNHMYNGELIHDCYYNIKNSNEKIVFFNDMQYVRCQGSELRLSTCYGLSVLNSIEVDENIKHVDLELDPIRDLNYIEFVRRTFGSYLIF